MKKSKIFFIHLGFWFALFILLYMPAWYIAYTLKISIEIGSVLVGLALIMIAIVPFYSMFFYGAVTKNKKWAVLLPIGMFSLLFILCLIYFRLETRRIEEYVLVFSALTIFLIFGFFGYFSLYQIKWLKSRQKQIELEQQQMKSNMALLRSQINPHFLFNTLHNIDTLIYDNQDKASKSLVKLSDIMRYMLKEAKFDFVDLGKEIKHLESYLSLEKLRLKNEKFLEFTLSGDSKGKKIAPMIMIPFVENAFKHAVDSNIENGIGINIKIENHKLYFLCENQYDISDSDKDKTHGIGLETVKKRLDLIYKNKHNLVINSEDSVFKVNLELELDEN